MADSVCDPTGDEEGGDEHADGGGYQKLDDKIEDPSKQGHKEEDSRLKAIQHTPAKKGAGQGDGVADVRLVHGEQEGDTEDDNVEKDHEDKVPRVGCEEWGFFFVVVFVVVVFVEIHNGLLNGRKPPFWRI